MRRGAVLSCGVVVAMWAAGVSLANVTPDRIEGLTPAALFPWAQFDPAVPTQEQVTGVRPGSRPLRHGELLRLNGPRLKKEGK